MKIVDRQAILDSIDVALGSAEGRIARLRGEKLDPADSAEMAKLEILWAIGESLRLIAESIVRRGDFK